MVRSYESILEKHSSTLEEKELKQEYKNSIPALAKLNLKNL